MGLAAGEEALLLRVPVSEVVDAQKDDTSRRAKTTNFVTRHDIEQQSDEVMQSHTLFRWKTQQEVASTTRLIPEKNPPSEDNTPFCSVQKEWY